MVTLSILGFILPILFHVLALLVKASITALKASLKASQVALKVARTTAKVTYKTGKFAYKAGKYTYKAGKKVTQATKNTVSNLASDSVSDARFNLNKVGNEEQLGEESKTAGKVAGQVTVLALKTAIKTLQFTVSLLRTIATILLSANLASLFIAVVVLMMCISLITASATAGTMNYKGGSISTSKKDSKLDSTQISGDASTWIGACELTWSTCQAKVKEIGQGGNGYVYGGGRLTLKINDKKHTWVNRDCSGTVSLALNVFGIKGFWTSSSISTAKLKGFKLLKIGEDIKSVEDLRAGDIITDPGSHVQVIVEDGKKGGKLKTYNWGSDDNCMKSPYVVTYRYEGGCIKDGHTYTHVQRYVGE